MMCTLLLVRNGQMNKTKIKFVLYLSYQSSRDLNRECKFRLAVPQWVMCIFCCNPQDVLACNLNLNQHGKSPKGNYG